MIELLSQMLGTTKACLFVSCFLVKHGHAVLFLLQTTPISTCRTPITDRCRIQFALYIISYNSIKNNMSMCTNHQYIMDGHIYILMSFTVLTIMPIACWVTPPLRCCYRGKCTLLSVAPQQARLSKVLPSMVGIDY